MSRHRRSSDRGTDWLVSEQGHDDHLCYWYTGKAGDDLEDQAGATSATVAVGWARIRSSQVSVRTPDHRTYWSGAAPTPLGSAGAWVEDTRRTTKNGSREGRT